LTNVKIYDIIIREFYTLSFKKLGLKGKYD